MLETEKQKFLKEFESTPYFKAEILLENQILQDATKKLFELDITNPSFQLQYAKLSGVVEAIRSLQNTRNLIISVPTVTRSIKHG